MNTNIKLSLSVLISFLLIACNNSTTNNEIKINADSIAAASKMQSDVQNNSNVNMIDGKVDSLVKIGDKEFLVSFTHYDLTEIATSKGDTMSRPTYACSVKIYDASKKIIFMDSLLRDSWGYPGKISPIDAYEIAMPMLKLKGNEIISEFMIYDRQKEEGILASLSFNTVTYKPNYFFEESTPEN